MEKIICPYCGTKTDAQIVQKSISHASWGGDYDYTGADAVNQCLVCANQYNIRADFWLDDYSLKKITNIPLPKTQTNWYALAEIRGNQKPDENRIIKNCQVNLMKIFDNQSEALEVKKKEFAWSSLVQLIKVSAEGFVNEEGYILEDKYQLNDISIASVHE